MQRSRRRAAVWQRTGIQRPMNVRVRVTQISSSGCRQTQKASCSVRVGSLPANCWRSRHQPALAGWSQPESHETKLCQDALLTGGIWNVAEMENPWSRIVPEAVERLAGGILKLLPLVLRSLAGQGAFSFRVALVADSVLAHSEPHFSGHGGDCNDPDKHVHARTHKRDTYAIKQKIWASDIQRTPLHSPRSPYASL